MAPASSSLSTRGRVEASRAARASVVSRSAERRSTNDGRAAPESGEEGAEVGVLGHEHPILGDRELEHLVVVGRRHAPLADVHGVVAGVAEQHRDAGGEVLVDEQLHPATSGSSRSWTASAAKARAARMSSCSRSG